jgi:signal transduction histidine kinase
MLTNTLIIYFTLSMLFIILILRKISQLKNEQRIYREKIAILCHDFKTSLTTLHLAVDSLKDYAKLQQANNKDSGGLTPLLDIFDDVGQSIAQSIAKLLQQIKNKSKREGVSL